MSDGIEYLSLPSFDSSKPSQPGEPASPPAPGRYRIDGDLGSGGMGAVFKAYDVDLHREVAIKVLHGYEPTPDMLAKFREEAQIGAQLEHPAIVPIYDFGVDRDGRIFIVMKLVRGCALDSCADLTPLRRIQVVQQIAQALAFAHEKGVIHRDLKPANIMTGAHGEVQIMDWGLAKVLGTPDRPIAVRTARTEGDTTRTMEGTVQGTPHFMAPEQARGEPLDARADLYALGAILHHLLCGEPPVVGKSVEEIIDKVARGDIRPLPASVPRELRSIAAKAMALRPDDRYQTATAFHDDLQAYLEGRPGAAWRDSLPTRARKWLKRHPAVGVSAALAVIAVVATFFILERRPGKLTVVTDPIDAEVWVANDLLDNAPRRLPYEVHGQGAPLAPRSYLVTVKKPGYDDATLAVIVPPGRTAELRYRLVPQLDHYFFSSDPQGAQLILTPKGTGNPIEIVTPFVVEVPRGEYDVRVSLDGYVETHALLRVSGVDQNLQEIYALDKAGVGLVRVRGLPAGTRVTFQRDGAAPRTVTLPHDDPIELPAGRYAVRAELERHVPDDKTLDIAEGREEQLLLCPRPQDLWRVKPGASHPILLPVDFDADGTRDLLVGAAGTVRAYRGFDGTEIWRHVHRGLNARVRHLLPCGDGWVAVTEDGASTHALSDGSLRRAFALDVGMPLGALLAPVLEPDRLDLVATGPGGVTAVSLDRPDVRWTLPTPGVEDPHWPDMLMRPEPAPGELVRRLVRGSHRLTEKSAIVPFTQLIDLDARAVVKEWPESRPLALADADGDGREDTVLLADKEVLRCVRLSDGQDQWTKERFYIDRFHRRGEFVEKGRLAFEWTWYTDPAQFDQVHYLRVRDGGSLDGGVPLHERKLRMPWPGGLLFSDKHGGFTVADADRTLASIAAGPSIGDALVSADFDGDGRPDLAVELGPEEVACCSPTGARFAGGWAAADRIAEGTLPRSCVVAGRWLIELRNPMVAYDAQTGAIAWTRDGGGPPEVHVAPDHDRDGVRDIVLSFLNESPVILSTACGLPLKRATFKTLGLPLSIPDVDGDGVDDLFVVLDDARLSAISSATLEIVASWKSPDDSPGIQPTDAALVRDFDGDGAWDVSLLRRSNARNELGVSIHLSGSRAWRQSIIFTQHGVIPPKLRWADGRLTAILQTQAVTIEPDSAEVKLIQMLEKDSVVAVVGEDLDLWETGYKSGSGYVGGVQLRRWSKSGDRWVLKWDAREHVGSPAAFIDIDGDRDPDPIVIGPMDKLFAAAARDGKVLWRLSLPENARDGPYLVGGDVPFVIIRLSDRWIRVDPRSGRSDFTWIAGEGVSPGAGSILK